MLIVTYYWVMFSIHFTVIVLYIILGPLFPVVHSILFIRLPLKLTEAKRDFFFPFVFPALLSSYRLFKQAEMVWHERKVTSRKNEVRGPQSTFKWIDLWELWATIQILSFLLRCFPSNCSGQRWCAFRIIFQIIFCSRVPARRPDATEGEGRQR